MVDSPSLLEKKEKIHSNGGEEDDKAIATKEHVVNKGRVHVHVWYRKSDYSLAQVKKGQPDVYDAIVSLPWDFIHYWDDGIALSPRIYAGIKRNGPKYIYTWIEENRLSLSTIQARIVACAHFHHAFFTYTQMFQYFNENDWGELSIDRTHAPIDSFPQYSKGEENQRERSKRIEAQEKEIVCVARELGCNLEDLVSQNVKSRHQCGTILKQGFWFKSKSLRARCPKCDKIIELSSSSEVDKG